MCVVSAVMDHGRQQWPDLVNPQPWMTPVVTEHPRLVVWPPQQPPQPKLPTKEEIEAFLKLYKAAQEYDAKTGQPDCEDPEKIKVLEAIEKRLAAIEERLAAQDAEREQENIAYSESVKL